MTIKQPAPTAPKDRNPAKTARINLAIINGKKRGRLRFPKYGGGSGNVKQEE